MLHISRWRSALVTIVAGAAALLSPTAATAADPDNSPNTVCVPESLTLYSVTTDEYLCFAAPMPRIDPPFPTTWAHNGYQGYWCVFSATDYQGWMVRVPPFTQVDVNMTVASATGC